MSKLTDAVLALAGPVAAQQGCEIWDVEYVKEAGSREQYDNGDVTVSDGKTRRVFQKSAIAQVRLHLTI